MYIQFKLHIVNETVTRFLCQEIKSVFKIIYVEGIYKWNQVISAVIASVMTTLFIMEYKDWLICDFNSVLLTEQP